MRSSDAFEIQRCEPLELSDVLAAAAFVDKSLTAMVDRMSFLTRQQQAEVIRKWPRSTLRCRERLNCRRGAVGFAHGGPGTGINICHSRMVDLSMSLCDIVDTILHESGHAHGFPTLPAHNSDPDRVNDTVYRVGNVARDVCLEAATAGTFANTALQGTPRLALGASCRRGTDCQSGTCRRQTCVCNDDFDCGLNEVCLTLGENRCEPANLSAGAACKRNRQCQSNNCRRDVCR
jgi:hypothetical protein